MKAQPAEALARWCAELRHRRGLRAGATDFCAAK